MTDHEVDELLKHWAEWIARDQDADIEYPPKTVFGRLVDGDISSANGFGPSIPQLQKRDFRAEAVNRAVLKMTKISLELGNALALQYCHTGSSTEKAKELGVSKRMYFTLVERGRLWLSGFMTAVVTQIVNPDYQYRLEPDRGVGARVGN